MTPYFFGYGSLVNRYTHSYPDARPARLSGWARTWVHTSAREAVYLSVTRTPGVIIDGLVAAVPDADWAALDLREAAYVRVSSRGAITHDLPSDPEISHYTVETTAMHDGRDGFILLSYLDVVVKGFLAEFGEPGVARFFETTQGWDTPVLNDRADPRYPRYTPLTRSEERLVDDCLSALPPRAE